jgi:L,D-transpeptidase YcbB
MKKQIIPFAALLLCSAAAAPDNTDILWTPATVGQLLFWIDEAPKEGLCMPPDPDFVHALNTDEPALVYPTATTQALKLARLHLFGCATPEQRKGWNIPNNDERIDLQSLLAAALTKGDLNSFFKGLRPKAPDYEALRLAYATEADPLRRATLARNMDRWRWMSLNLGARYLLVNAPGFEVTLRENGQNIGRWRVIVGKPKTPTPVFSAIVTGVTVNPWWEVPQSIVAESVGRLTRANPAEARRRGYVWGGGSYRQRPGPNNALGQMKLVMPNPYNVYLHDTPNKALFEKPVRTFSHGCIRVGDALGLASTLLGRAIDDAVASKLTATLPITTPIPVYITYFTADISDLGTVEYHPDIYGRDTKMGDSRNPSTDCPA